MGSYLLAASMRAQQLTNQHLISNEDQGTSWWYIQMADLRFISGVSPSNSPVGVLSCCMSLNVPVTMVRDSTVIQTASFIKRQIVLNFGPYSLYASGLAWGVLFLGRFFRAICAMKIRETMRGEFGNLSGHANVSSLGVISESTCRPAMQLSRPALLNPDQTRRLPELRGFFGAATGNGSSPSVLLTAATVNGALCLTLAFSKFSVDPKWAQRHLDVMEDIMRAESE